MKEVTSNDMAELWGVEYLLANSFLKMLVKCGIAKKGGTRKIKPGKGKGANLYLIPENISLDLTKENFGVENDN